MNSGESTPPEPHSYKECEHKPLSATAALLAIIFVFSGCGGGGSAPSSGNSAMSPAGRAPVLVSLQVSPASPGITEGTAQQLSAIGTYSDSSMVDLTSSVTWTSLNTTVATVSGTGLAASVSSGITQIIVTSGGVSGRTLLTVNPLAFTLVNTAAVTTSAEGGSARPEVVAAANRVYVVYLGLGSATDSRSFNVKIFDSNLSTQITSTTIVTTVSPYGGPTDIRLASDGQAVYAFYDTYSDATGTSYLWGAKYALNDSFDRLASTPAPIAQSTPMATVPDGHELLDDPAPVIGPNSVFVITRYNNSLAKSGSTMYHVREFSKDTLTQRSSFELDLSAAADGRGRVASFLFWNNSIYAALATTVSDTVKREDSEDGALSDLVLVRMNQDWTFDPLQDVRTLSAEADDVENYVSGLKADGTYFYVTYKQSVGSPPTGEQRAVIKTFDSDFDLLLEEQVRSIAWGGGSGEIRPSLEVSGKRIYSGQSASQGTGTNNADIFIFDRN